MPYQFARENRDYSNFASGRVFYGAPGHPALPVRLISELFQRCVTIRQNMGLTDPVEIYDPCCGSAYHLSVLAYLHWRQIGAIMASDIDEDILAVAARNLNLLTETGLRQRAQDIAMMQEKYRKSSHADAAVSAQQLTHQLQENSRDHTITTRLFAADATSSGAIAQGLKGRKVDLVIADIPYGNRSTWQSARGDVVGETSLLGPMLEALIPALSPETIVAIIADKAQKCVHEQYKRVGRFQIGKRRMTLLQKH